MDEIISERSKRTKEEERAKAHDAEIKTLRANVRRERERVTQLEQKAAILEAALKQAYRMAAWAR
jgi:hypothetical protein